MNEPIRAKLVKGSLVFEGDGKKHLGDHLREIGQAAQLSKSSLLKRWEKNQAYYDNQPEASNLPYVDAPLVHHPLTFPKLNKLCATILTTVFSQDVVFLGSYAANEPAAKRVQKQLAFFLDDELEPVIDEIAPCVTIRNHGFLRVTFEAAAQGFLPLANVKSRTGNSPFASAGLRFDYIPPENEDIFPDTAKSIQDAQYVGHRFWRQVRDIWQLQDAGRYDKDVEIKVTGHPSDTESSRDFGFGRTEQARTAELGEQLVQLAEAIFKYDFNGKGDKRWIATYLFDTGEILKIKPYLPSRPWKVDFRIKPKGADSYWSATSVAQDLQGLQWQYNIQHNILAYGTLMKAFQPILSEGPAGKVQKVSPASVVSIPGKVIGGLQSTFDPGASTLIIQQIERQADVVTGVTMEGAGGSISKRQTKAEYEGRQSGAEKTLAKFLQTFNLGLVEVAEIAQELLYLNYEVWTLAYPDCVYCSKEDLALPIRWRVAGSTPESTPEMRLETLAYARQIAVEEQMMAQGQPDAVTGQMVPQIDPLTGMPVVPVANLQKLDRAIFRALPLTNVEEFLNPEPTEDMNGNGNAAAMGLPGIPPDVQAPPLDSL